MKKAFILTLCVLLLAACAQVLGIRPASKRPFPHRVHVLNKGITCLQCHTGIDTATDTDPLHIPDQTKCVSCHTKPHDTRDCQSCHGLQEVRESAKDALDHLKFKHATHLPKVKDNCAFCHSGVTSDSDHVRPPMALCLSCHEHQDDFAQARTCDRCHKDIRAEAVRPESHVAHDGDWLREHGNRAYAARELCTTCHADKFCASCHGKTTPILPEKMTFDDPLRAGVHRAGFRSRHSLEARTQPGLCTTCHSTGEFCESCHSSKGVDVGSGGSSPHPSGWVGLRGEHNDHGTAAWRDPSVCASCHTGAGEKLCVGCHKVGAIGGNPHRPGWTSKLRPRIDQPCRSCHEGQP
ncbi:MAG: cytochrome c3 family protein [Polyangiales bacterium]